MPPSVRGQTHTNTHRYIHTHKCAQRWGKKKKTLQNKQTRTHRDEAFRQRPFAFSSSLYMFIIWPLRYWNAWLVFYPSARRTSSAMSGNTADAGVRNEIAATQSWPLAPTVTGVWSHVSGNHGSFLWLRLPQQTHNGSTRPAGFFHCGRGSGWRWWCNGSRKKKIWSFSQMWVLLYYLYTVHSWLQENKIVLSTTNGATKTLNMHIPLKEFIKCQDTGTAEQTS